MKKILKNILVYVKSVRGEWFKIVWPSRDSVVHATIMILVVSGLAALFFFVVDSVLNAIVGWIF
ncbi:MAG: preprotein translocase subunit SecE [Alphaproteobacteria bacterium]|nr:preprotein translocase subunit SecE [Alphaproteobacteria bacterium]